MRKTFFPIVVAMLLLCACGKNNEKQLYGGIRETDKYNDLYGGSTEVRAELAYVTDDEIPELLVSDGDYHASGITVFTLDQSENIISLGTFGSNGEFEYAEKEGYISCEYGNQGSFFHTISAVGKNTKLIGAVFALVNGVTGEERYFTDFAPSGMTGDNSFDYLLYSVPDTNEVTEDEYQKAYDELMSVSQEWIEISYEEMASIDSIVR